MTRLILLALCTLCTLCTLCVLPAADHSYTVTVMPDSMGLQFSREGLKDGDSVTVTLQPASGYIIKRSRVSDPLLLGWRKISNHVFRLAVKNPPTDSDWQTANFNGTLVRIGSPGAGDSSVTVDELPFDFDGRVKRVGGDEGVSSDFNRKPPADLASTIGNCPETPSGKATLTRTVKGNTTTRKLTGTFQDGASLYMGQYNGDLKADDNVKKNPVHLGSETGPSPGGTGATVTIAYHGASGKIGGVAYNEQILHNTWDSNVAAAKAAADAADAAVKAATTALSEARTALTDARAAATKAAKAAADAKKAVDDLIDKLVQQEADRLAAARTAAANAQKDIDDAAKAMDAAQRSRDEAERLNGTNSTQYRTANQALTKATAAKVKATKELAAITKQIPKLEEALAKARAKAEKDKSVQQAQAESDRLAELSRQADAAVTAAVAAVTAAEERLRAADAAFDPLWAAYIEALADEKYYQEALPGLLGHERQHRDILLDHVRMLTDLLSKLRSIGWSPDPAKAVTLSREYWPVCVAALERDIQGREEAAQQKFDRDTDHGRR